jgi:lysophospholipase L1-like esterase
LHKRHVFLFFHFFATTLFAQTACPPFWNEIQQFKKADSAKMPPKGAILLVGSSSFTKWKDVQDYFPGYTIINRGFGGSRLTDVIRYAYDVILPYAPKQVLVYCGENDLADDSTLDAGDVVLRFKTLFGIIRQNLPEATIHFISLKPSPSRQHLFSKFLEANADINSFLKKQKRAGFINVYDAMLDATGNPKKEIFVEDRLHMNAEGYRIWQKVLLPYLQK